jgi:hypothetical protein
MRNKGLSVAHIFVASLMAVTPLFWFDRVYADNLSTRSVTIASPIASATTEHRFDFTIPSVSSVGSIEFEYCSNTPLIGSICDAPTGLSLSAATLATQAGETGFSIDPVSSVNRIVLSRTASLTSIGPTSYTFSGVVNQDTNSTVYVRIATFASTDGSGPRTDSGAVAYSTNNLVTVNAFVPPYLRFCVGIVVSANCTSFSGTYINFGELSTTQARAMSSQFAVATNDPLGYVTSVVGTTMTSGNNIIPGLTPPQPSSPGSSQFGMNLRANSSPAVGSDPTGVGTGTLTPNFANPNQFYFGSNETVVTSNLPSDYNVFTVSYLVNVSTNQSPGVYTTTLTYIATAAF